MNAVQLTLDTPATVVRETPKIDIDTRVRIKFGGTVGIVVGWVADWPRVAFSSDGSFIGGWTLCCPPAWLEVVT